MQVHFINVGYGEAILVTRGDFVMLIDGGTNRNEEYENPGCIRVEEYLKKIGIMKVDIIIITHIHDDHIGGIVNIIKEFSVSEVWINVKPGVHPKDVAERLKPDVEKNLSGILFRNALESYTYIFQECENRGIPIIEKGSVDEIIPLGTGLSAQILSPNKEIQNKTAKGFNLLFLERDINKAKELFCELDTIGNKTSISLRVAAGKASVLLTGDQVDGWDEIYKKYGDGLKSQILKITHHGQIDGMPESMVKLAQPENFVICSSIDRRFNSAHPSIIDRANAYLKETNKKGSVYITGCLFNNIINNKEFCAVNFRCDEITGEISTFLVEK